MGRCLRHAIVGQGEVPAVGWHILLTQARVQRRGEKIGIAVADLGHLKQGRADTIGRANFVAASRRRPRVGRAVDEKFSLAGR